MYLYYTGIPSLEHAMRQPIYERLPNGQNCQVHFHLEPAGSGTADQHLQENVINIASVKCNCPIF
jgi:hypothetical protein